MHEGNKDQGNMSALPDIDSLRQIDVLLSDLFPTEVERLVWLFTRHDGLGRERPMDWLIARREAELLEVLSQVG